MPLCRDAARGRDSDSRNSRTTSERGRNVTRMNARSLPAVLRTCARLQPNNTAFTFIDYEQDWAGVAESLTWSQLYRRTLNVAQELRLCGSTGDRAVISAPQGLDYITAFLGALQAGLIAVPLSVPQGGASDERVSSVLRDASPVCHSHDILCRRQYRRVCRVEARSNPLHRSSRLICWTWTLGRTRCQRRDHADICVFAIHFRIDPSARRRHGLAQKHPG